MGRPLGIEVPDVGEERRSRMMRSGADFRVRWRSCRSVWGGRCTRWRDADHDPVVVGTREANRGHAMDEAQK